MSNLRSFKARGSDGLDYTIFEYSDSEYVGTVDEPSRRMRARISSSRRGRATAAVQLAGAGSEWEDRIAAAVRWGKAARLGCGIRRRDP